MIHGLAHGQFIDDKRYWPIFARAEALDVPIYLHPSMPHPAVIDAYYKEYAKDFPVLLRAAWGFTVETATLGDPPRALRPVRAARDQVHPRPSRRGAAVPALAHQQRPRAAGAEAGRSSATFSRAHFSVTTSGFFSDPALLLCVQELGIDRILFAVDYPFEANAPGPAWLARVPLCDEDKAKIASGNAKRLLRM